jgi:hypothetical protein
MSLKKITSSRGIYAQPKSIKLDINEAIESVFIAVAKGTIGCAFFPPSFREKWH